MGVKLKGRYIGTEWEIKLTLRFLYSSPFLVTIREKLGVCQIKFECSGEKYNMPNLTIIETQSNDKFIKLFAIPSKNYCYTCFQV
jgi:hypothetical protein